ncbi:DUF6706 family protein [Sphingobacterium sp. UBA6320]|uniref:DUF6706 family protein n=1 Tax=Sphingobacterium sp. UBA6320 TaxID=1947510 RepID=UPI0025D8A2C8|nr:DUF6706 family protein [Sphingobacterium sp. UBA6320]
MTKKEAFLQVVQVGSVDDQAAEMFLLSAGLTDDDQFVGDLNELELAAIPLLQSLLSVSSQSEGAASWSTNRDGIKDRLLFLARKHGLDDVVSALLKQPQIKKFDWGL